MDTSTRDVTSNWLEDFSRRCRTAFNRRNLTVRRSKKVHAVSWARGLGGFEFPLPACHVGVAGFDVDALHSTDEPVNCRRCGHHARDVLDLGSERPGAQLSFDLGDRTGG
ncbi:hypothetical protein [Amycolatopsis nigrescens]|uniref:hypothetical protein n=1 Tax=Amycolatopsis nigrescens TaxID=381445 RepID=UPI00036BC7FA|nr:hypothetical protein [Amycolatopsis nigrescens]